MEDLNIPSSTLRNIIMNDLKGHRITRIITHEFPSSELASMHPIIMERLSAIPVVSIGGNTLSLKETNNTNKDIIIRSDKLVGKGVEVHYKNILIMYLHPGESVNIDMEVSEGTGQQHVFFRTVEHVSITPDNKLVIEPLRPYTARQIFDQAVQYATSN
jgi:hypothetical protein